MSEDIKILSSKLAMPQTSDTIECARLLSLIKQSARKRLTMIVAGAGYGKTTLAAQAGHSCSTRTVWYRLDESDGDLATFITYLVAGIRKHYPEFGLATLQFLSGVHNPNNEVKPVLISFLNEIDETIHEELLIVLDDFHCVQESRQINEAVGGLLRDLPPFVHLLMTSRSNPSLPLSRLRAMREVMDIGEKDLAFKRGEVEQFCLDLFGLSLNDACAETLWLKTGGWVAGLILVCYSLRGKPLEEIETSVLNLAGSQRALFSYLEENIYRELSADQKDFLVKTSILPRINASLCDRFLGVDYSIDILKYLEANHLFTSSLDEARQWYSYHQLFRDFLVTNLRNQRNQDDIVKLHRDAAILMETCGEEDEAVRLYLAAEDYEGACTLLERVGRRLFAEGRFQLLSSYLNAIPAGFLFTHPWLRYLQGQLMGLCGKPQRAVENYCQALDCFLKRKEEEGIQACLLDLGLTHFQIGNLKTARNTYQELLDRKHLGPRVRIEALGYQIYLSSFFWEMDVADRCFDQATALLRDLVDDDLRHNCLLWIYTYRAFRYLFSLDFDQAIDTAEYMRSISPDSGSNRYPPGCYLLLPAAYLGLRLYSRGYEIAEEGLNLIKEGLWQNEMAVSGWHSPRLSSRGLRERGFPETMPPWLLVYSAANATELGKTTEALEAAGKSLKCFRKIGCRVGEAYSYSVLSRAYLKSGNAMAARRWARSGMEVIRGLTIPRIEGMLRFNVLESLIVEGEIEAALQCITEADGDVRETWMKTLSIQIHHSKDDGFDGKHKLLRSLQGIGRQLFDPLVILKKDWIVVLLIKLLARGTLQPRIRDLTARMRPEASDKLALLQTNGNPIVREVASILSKELSRPTVSSMQIYLLGKFRVLCGGEEIPPTRWKSRKARTILQYLACCRPKGYLNKEILMELLWPEEDPILTSRRFHVALASLRRTLEPNLMRGTPSSYIHRAGDSYALAPGKDGWVDVEEFTAEIRHAREVMDPEKALIHFLNAESLYCGDFLEEDRYSDWCCEPREQYRKNYLYVTRRIIVHHEQLGKWDQCIEYAEKHLQVDRYAEDIYRTMMVCYAKTGDHLSMVRTFRRCAHHIESELNCRLSEETELLYRRLGSTPIKQQASNPPD